MQATVSHFLHSGFHSSAQRHPGRPALLLDGRSWTYRELDGVVRVWAAALIKAGKRPKRVGILGHRSLVTYAGFLAASYAGATAVPLNKKYPVARNKDIAEQAGLDVILADHGSTGRLAELLREMTDAPAVLLPESAEAPPGIPAAVPVVTREGVEGCTPLADPVFPDTEDAAYLLFTSGSTGRPKGVPVSHANVAWFLRVNAERYGFTEYDRFTHTADQTFDLSIFDPFMAWASGACLVPMDSHQLLSPLGFIREHGITVWLSVPSVAALQARRGLLEPGSLPSLRWSLFCGEALPVPAARAWQEAASGSVLENLYGPTEATVACLVHRWDPRTSPERSVNGIAPIGAPYPGMEVALLAEDGTPVPDGETGELCLYGPQVFAGYWKAPEQTARAFHTTQHGDEPRRWYRTGDLGRRGDDGEYVYIGRLDTQVKILGHRIETGEVEAHLLQQEGVAQAVVLAVPGEEDGATVLAAIVSGDGIDMHTVEKGLSQSLPPYMIPLTFHALDDFPLNTNGKVDRTTLRDQVISGELEPFPL
ncbi:amino acid adenylation domain-containing protein [Streptomyces tubercidicus]|uniref:Amino acid adenylation protein n=1 Tax=Streptomyces tubercidicus TaxID=47759 RepID=A0A640UVV4_9ACTN|nr:amino acid adenylation domain-containing protein [Streptomyces tubercidicus]WAU14445.1 amino acid adenylation domain-containing protein [Streptomyces tubercidicus]GFE40183.1 amino acid adenylation protein [Streptomyces tubercidicus]